MITVQFLAFKNLDEHATLHRNYHRKCHCQLYGDFGFINSQIQIYFQIHTFIHFE